MREEVSRLETTTQGCIDKVGAIFSEAESLVTSAKRLVTQQLLDLKQTKLSLLQAQLDTVRAEKDKVKIEIFFLRSVFEYMFIKHAGCWTKKKILIVPNVIRNR